ncbi:MAG: helix-turn-helix domain-containing protein [Sneathiella sp.]|uniref:MerR family transcriptional regulator n=1 Tax=Sneathiella sp. TaxID=1964365 RepID=UPI003001CFB0
MTFKIGDLSKIASTKVVTIRYYEKLGLLSKPLRTSGNYRIYSEEQKDRLCFIRRCRNLGFSLDQVRELLDLSSQKNQKCIEIDKIAGEHLLAIEQKTRDLNRLAHELRKINLSCQGGGRIENCRIIEALSPGQSI